MNDNHDLGTKLQAIWDDQRAFNLLLRQPPNDYTQMADQVRDFILYTESELHELLRAVPWKKHRNVSVPQNTAHMEEEGIDALKCVMSLLQIIGIDTLDQLVDIYWRKTAVVVQRYREEWASKIDGPCVIVDLDNVIFDYVGGMCDWLRNGGRAMWGEELGPSTELLARIDVLQQTGAYVNAASLGIPQELWQHLKHQFRITGVKRTLPVFPDAWIFLQRMRMDGNKIIILTSRPIDTYPNIFTDTIMCLNDNRLPYDYVWWSTDKAERVMQMNEFRQHVRFAVDDDPRFVEQFANAGIPTYWLKRRDSFPDQFLSSVVTIVNTLSDVDRY